MNKNDNVTEHETEIGALLEQIKQLEDEIAGWKLKYIAVCEKKDMLEEGKDG